MQDMGQASEDKPSIYFSNTACVEHSKHSCQQLKLWKKHEALIIWICLAGGMRKRKESVSLMPLGSGWFSH